FGEPVTFPGGISFGRIIFNNATGKFETDGNTTSIEILNLMLGTGNDNFLVKASIIGAPESDDNPATIDAPALYGNLTLVQGGGNRYLTDPGTGNFILDTNGQKIIGGDHITVTGGGGSSSALAIFGDTSQDAFWYSGQAAVADG